MTLRNEQELAAIFHRADWVKDARCRGLDVGLFFPERGESTVAAVAVCRACPVREPCLELALTTGEKFGIFGGVPERGRRTLRRQRNQTRKNTAA